MLAKKAPSASQNRGYRKTLDYLHARKSAIDALIESLEGYDRFRQKPAAGAKINRA
jgi:hypothetical protein